MVKALAAAQNGEDVATVATDKYEFEIEIEFINTDEFLNSSFFGWRF